MERLLRMNTPWSCLYGLLFISVVVLPISIDLHPCSVCPMCGAVRCGRYRWVRPPSPHARTQPGPLFPHYTTHSHTIHSHLSTILLCPYTRLIPLCPPLCVWAPEPVDSIQSFHSLHLAPCLAQTLRARTQREALFTAVIPWTQLV